MLGCEIIVLASPACEAVGGSQWGDAQGPSRGTLLTPRCLLPPRMGLLPLVIYLAGKTYSACLSLMLLKPLYHGQDIWREPGKTSICVSQSIALTGSWHLALPEISNSLDAITVFPEPCKLSQCMLCAEMSQMDSKVQAKLPSWPERDPAGLPQLKASRLGGQTRTALLFWL